MKYLLMILGCLLMCSGNFQAAAQEEPKDWQSTIGAPATEARAQWQKLTEGVELAHGKKVDFFPPPNYPLTNDPNNPYDLTSGTLSPRIDDRVWFTKGAVGWLSVGTTNGVLMVIDLGSEQPVGQIAIRVLGGKEQAILGLPKSIQFLASADGQQYYTLQSMVKLMPGEKALSNFKTAFYIPEEGKAFMTSLVCHTVVRARYIALRITPEASLFADQISVLKANDNTPLKNLESFPKAVVYTDGLVVTPRYAPMVVTANIATPNWLTVLNNTGLNMGKSDSGFRLQLPDGLRVLPISQPAFKEVASSTPGTHSYEFHFTRNSGEVTAVYASQDEGPLWITKDPDATIPANATVKITGILQGKDSHTVTYPLQVVQIPEAPKFHGLDISLAWIGDQEEQEWPHFLRDFRKMGFGYVSTFPREFGKNKDGSWNADVKKNLDFLKEAREQGYGIIYDESPFHVMWNNIQAAQKTEQIDNAEAREIYNQVDGKRGQWMNILYRGKYFQDEIRRIADMAALVQPDQVYMDIEWWTPSVNESKNDPRVIAAWKASGKSWDDFVTDIGTEVLGDVVKGIRQAVPDRKLTVGLYDSDPTHAIYNSIFEWKKIYPGIVDVAMPSLYVQGRAQLVADRVRYDYEDMQSRPIIPWLTARTYGGFDPALMEPMVLESLLNGSRGITYFWFGDFDPMDFYYHSKALAELAPYQSLLQSGKPVEYKGDNPDLHYTVFASNNQALLLVSNYARSLNTKVNLPLPIKMAAKVLSEGKSLPIKNNAITVDVPPGKFRLIYVSK